VREHHGDQKSEPGVFILFPSPCSLNQCWAWRLAFDCAPRVVVELGIGIK
jgi:hypothetical protein